MSANQDLRASLRRILLQPTNGVVGIGDALVELADAHELHLDWHFESGRVRVFGGCRDILVDEPYRKSVFRAILARVAQICCDRGPADISPYGGNAEFMTGPSAETLVRVAFVNTPDTQRLDLCWTPASVRSTNGTGGVSTSQVGPAAS